MVSCLVLTDYFLLVSDFNNCLHLLTTARDEAVQKNQTFIVKFVNKRITIENSETGALFGSLDVLTLKRANFETAIEKETRIVIDRAESPTVRPTHDLDIALKSLLGFSKHIRLISK